MAAETKPKVDSDYISIVFEGEFGPEIGLKFVEMENSAGFSIDLGEWVRKGDNHWELHIPVLTEPNGEIKALKSGDEEILDALSAVQNEYFDPRRYDSPREALNALRNHEPLLGFYDDDEDAEAEAEEVQAGSALGNSSQNATGEHKLR